MFNLLENSSTPINSTIGNITATDLDGDVLTYTIQFNSNIPQFTTIDGEQSIQFIGPQLLDYEANLK